MSGASATPLSELRGMQTTYDQYGVVRLTNTGNSWIPCQFCLLNIAFD